MKSAEIYIRNFPKFPIYVEETPKTGDKFLDVVCFDGIDFLHMAVNPTLQSKFPLLIKEKGEALSIVILSTKEGDGYLRRERESGKVTAVKRFAIASPVYYVSNPLRMNVSMTYKHYIYDSTTETETKEVSIYNAMTPLTATVKAKDDAASGFVAGYTALGNQGVGFAGKTMFALAGNVEYGNTSIVPDYYTNTANGTLASERIVGAYRVI